MNLSREVIYDMVHIALREDINQGDLTTLSVIPATTRAEALIVTREAGVVSGLPVVEAVFQSVDPRLVVSPKVSDGDRVKPGDVLALVMGYARGILSGERVALNFLQRMSGISTLAARYVAAVEGLPVRILDTRKTTPGLRLFEKYAVRVGGATNHRFGLYDAVMIKDNHLELLASAGWSLGEAVQRARAEVGPMVRIEVEVESLDMALVAAESGADMILLDNMAPSEMCKVVEAVGHKVLLEASGGITMDTIRAVAETGVHFISVGALTHSARALDMSLELITQQY